MTAVSQTWPDSGELVRRVTIRLWTDTPDLVTFDIDQSFSAGITRWAKIEPVVGVAYWNGKQIGEEVTHRIWVRYTPQTQPELVTPQHVIDYPANNRRFRVVRALNVGDAQRYTLIECKDLGPIQ